MKIHCLLGGKENGHKKNVYYFKQYMEMQNKDQTFLLYHYAFQEELANRFILNSVKWHR